MPTDVSGTLNPLTADADAVLIALERIEDGGLAEAEAIVDGEAESLILHRDGERVRGWLNICPHAGRRLDWAPGKFLLDKELHLVCPAHGATFELRHGECISGPCRGARLRPVDVEVRAGHVCLRSVAGAR